MLKITKATDPIEIKNITACLYSPPGIGKTSTAFTADRPLLLDFDKGSHRSKNRRDTVQIEAWSDVTAISAEDLAPYKTLIVDTAGRALDVLTAHIMKSNPKAANKAGALSLQGYGELKAVFTTWMKLVRSFGLDVVLLSHSDEQKDGDDLRERLDIQGGSKNEIYKACDVMGRIYLSSGKRTLNFSPTDTAFGKNPAGFEPIEVPNFNSNPDFLAGVIAATKAELNKLSAEQTEIVALLSEWKAHVDEAKTPADFDALVLMGKQLDERIRDNAKRLLVKAARDLEIVFDAKAGAFVGKTPSAAAVAAIGAVVADEMDHLAKATGDLAAKVDARAAQAAADREPGSDDGDDGVATDLPVETKKSGRKGRAA